jgi:hypothetical protein
LTAIVNVSGWTNTGIAYGEYSGGSWTWYGPMRDFSHNGGNNGSTEVGVTYNAAIMTTPDGPQETFRQGRTRANVDIAASGGYGTTYAYTNPAVWKNLIDNNVFIFRWDRSGDNLTGWMNLGSGAESDTWTGDVNRTITLTGAWKGTPLYTVAEDGHFWLAASGLAFVDTFTWLQGSVLDAQISGGGELWWSVKALAASNVPMRVSFDRGHTWTDHTGNIWALLSAAQTLRNVALIY